MHSESKYCIRKEEKKRKGKAQEKPRVDKIYLQKQKKKQSFVRKIYILKTKLLQLHSLSGSHRSLVQTQRASAHYPVSPHLHTCHRTRPGIILKKQGQVAC